MWEKTLEGLYQTTCSLEFMSGYFKLCLDWIEISEICEWGVMLSRLIFLLIVVMPFQNFQAVVKDYQNTHQSVRHASEMF